MSVINSTNFSFCLYCKRIGGKDDFHDIFDESVLELQLPKLVGDFFGINVDQNVDESRKYLCNDCVNHLIELYDLEEHKKQTIEAAHSSATEAAQTTLNVEAEYDQSIVDQIDVEEDVDNNDYTEDNIYVCIDDEEIYEQNVDKDDILGVVDQTGDDCETVYEEEQVSDEILELENYGEHHSGNEEYVEVITLKEEDLKNQEIDNLYLEIQEEEEEAGQDDFEENTLNEELEQCSTIEENSNIIEKTDESEDDTLISLSTLEEEHLIEEELCPEEYDDVDLNEYLDRAIITNFESLQLKWTVECRLCLYKHFTFQELLKHPCINELVGEQQGCCIVDNCSEIVTNMKTLARHLIIKHYNKVQNVPIYGRCPECQKTFSTINDFNKHSCYHLKRVLGTRNYCSTCCLDFQSQKRFTFHMQFHLSKHRPKICLLCGAMFDKIDDFFDHVQYGHQSNMNMACTKCDRFFSDKNVFEQHLASHNSKNSYDCPECPKKYTNKSSLTKHMDVYHNHKMRPLQCEYCYKVFLNKNNYQSHIRYHMPEEKVPVFICSECGLISNDENIIENHLISDDCDGSVVPKVISLAFACECCSLDFFSAKHLQNHRLSPNHNENIFYCPICLKDYKTLKHMRNHLSSHKEYDEWLKTFPIDRMYMCDVGTCTEAYPLWTSLYYHKKRHKTNKTLTSPLICQFCKKVCPTKMSLAIHVARSHNNSNVKCQYCKKSYKTLVDLKMHIDYMHITAKCSECQKVFKNQRNLFSHEQLVHKKEKRYYCSHCDKGYYHKSELKAHERNAHPDTVYKCQLCKFQTTYPNSLDIHRMTKHEKKFPFKCLHCSKGFARKQLMVVHMKRHEEDNEFICNEYSNNGCYASFTTYFLLKKHIDNDHPTTSQGISSSSTATKGKQEDCIRKNVLVFNDETGEVEYIVGGETDFDDMISGEEYEIHNEIHDDQDELVDELIGDIDEIDVDYKAS
ncbi:uncharacterized protein LOC142240274 [Haematobia irritans]|uniref:uncharacterized protein LOC142240274 n=1 Tax=Haematobia irritans TaxID=7368 RepID=UPI003F504401